MMSPVNSSVVVISTFMTGSRIVGLAFCHGVLEGQRAGDLERHFRGVDVVVLAVEQPHLEVDHRIAGEEAAPAGLLDPLLDRRPEVVRDGAAEDLVGEREVLAARQRLDLDLAVGELAAAAGLLLVPAVAVGGLAGWSRGRAPWADGG